MHVLHVITTINRGGAENHLLELVRYQVGRGWKVTVAYLLGDGYWQRELTAMGVAVAPLGLRRYGDPRPLWRLLKLLKGSRFDLVHAHLPPAELYLRVALVLAGMKRLPFVISKHNDCPFHRLPGEKAMGRRVAARAAAVIAISSAVERYMTGPDLGLPADLVHTIRYGIDPAPFEQANARKQLRKEWGIAERELVIGCVGRLVEQKSIDTLIRAFALFINKCKGEHAAKLVIVGHGPLEESLRHCAQSSGAADNIVWAGFREDVPAVMSAFDIFALSSIFEGFGLVLIEAMASGLPVIATRAGAIGEVVVDGVTGLLAPVRQPLALLEAMGKLSEPRVRERMGKAGRERVKQEFTLERMCESTEALYQRCLQAEQRSVSV